MITFTKEQLMASAHARIEFAEMMLAGELEPLKERTWSIELELARIALASLEAEPVAWRYRFVHTPKSEEHGSPFTTDWVLAHSEDECNPSDCFERQPLFTAPPAPVSVPKVPNSVTAETCNLDELGHDWNDAEYYAQGWNACRAAMLQGADGSLTDEGAKRVDELVMWIKRLARSLRKSNPDSKLQSDAMDYLSRKGLIGVEDILR
ncbi:hypothetical protein ACK04L_002923 [Enterobacter roggenkampii]